MDNKFMTIIKEHQYAFMKTQNEILELEINGTAEYILKQNGLSRYAELICEKCNLHTFQDLTNLTSEKIKSMDLDENVKIKLTRLVINCIDENTYKIYRRQKLHRQEINRREGEELDRLKQDKIERNKRIEQGRAHTDEGSLDSYLSALELTRQSRSNTRERARGSLENLLAKLVS